MVVASKAGGKKAPNGVAKPVKVDEDSSEEDDSSGKSYSHICHTIIHNYILLQVFKHFNSPSRILEL